MCSQHLTKVDLYRYDEAWELSPAHALPMDPETLVIDFRRQADFREWHFPAALSIPLASLMADSPSPFFAPELLDQQWTELESLFTESYLQSQFRDRKILCLCYNGDTARVATSVLRAKGFHAESVKGGQHALAETELFKTTYLPRLESLLISAEAKKADSVVDEKSEPPASDSEGSDKKSNASDSDVE
jgi:cysteine synthase A